MCEHGATPPSALRRATPEATADASSACPTPRGSRRTRLWELPAHCHCPLIGVCLPLATLRRVVGKALGGEPLADDYELHVGVVSQCTTRQGVTEALQRELDRRYDGALRHFAQAKCTHAVAARWQAAVQAGDVAGALWAALTHPRCDEALREAVCRDIHMIQHQAGAMKRADLMRLDTLQQQLRQATHELGRAQQRLGQQQAERAAEQERQAALLMHARAEAIRKDTLLATLRGELAELREALPELQSRKHLAQRVNELATRNRALEHELADVKRQLAEAERGARADRPAPAPAGPTSIDHAVTDNAPAALAQRQVLCVGGRLGVIPVYRQIVERQGGRFTHHDGGLEDNPHRLDASLAQADLVICQTGCLSHNAYWLVKDHCKRTGKRCVYLDKPSVAGFVRGLAALPGETRPATEEEPR